jgi:hypothetical protein
VEVVSEFGRGRKQMGESEVDWDFVKLHCASRKGK